MILQKRKGIQTDQIAKREIKDKVYYEYGENKFEQATKDYWDKIKNS